MKITDIDLSSLRYDPSKPKQLQKLRDDYPGDFDGNYENLKLKQYDDEILRYIILVYDMRSPLWQSIKTHNERKVKSMLMSGFEANSHGRFDHEVESALLYGKDKGIARMFVKYVYLFNSVDYSELVGNIELNSKILVDIHNNKVTKDSMKNLRETSARIKELTSSLFGGKETKEIEEQLYEQLAMSRISFRPESVVRQVSSGKTEDVFIKDIYGSRKAAKRIKRKIEFGDA